jgi:hypothetical protein
MSTGIKKSGVFSLLGEQHGKQLINFLTNCCDKVGSICESIKQCLGISSNGNPGLVLNQQGDWINTSGLRIITETFFDTHNQPNYRLAEIPNGGVFQIFRDYATYPGLLLAIPPAYEYDSGTHTVTFSGDPVVSGETLYFYYSY